MKRTRKIDDAVIHQISLLEKYYDIDKEKKEINVKLYYDKASDLLDFAVGDVGKEMFNNDVLEKVNEVTDKFPSDYKTNIFFVVNDFEGYSVDVLTEKLKDIIDLNSFQVIKNRKRTWFTAAILVLVGFILLLILGVGKANDWMEESVKKEVIEEMLDITSWVFIWQAVTVLFLEHSDLSKMGGKFIYRIKSVSFMDNKLNNLKTINKDELLESWDNDSKVSSIRKVLLLISSTIIIAIGLYQISDLVSYIVKEKHTASDVTFEIIFDVIGIVIYVLAGVGGLYKYMNKPRFRILSKILAVFLGLVIVLAAILYIATGDFKGIVLFLLSVIVYVIFIISIFMPDNKFKKIKKNKKNKIVNSVE